jgi:hypothetical protein
VPDILERFLVGQNMFYWSSTYRSDKLPSDETLEVQRTGWTQAMTAWYDEVTKFDRRHVEIFQ